MKYSIDIKGMHCSGCKNLIGMSLEDEHMRNVAVSDEQGKATFEAEADQAAVKEALDRVFADLPAKYSYKNLQPVT